MDYEKKYKEAISRARQFSEYPLLENSSNIVEYIFPELKESEDTIRKKLLSAFKSIMADADEDELWYGLSYNDIIAWLEKQGKKEKFIEKELGNIRGYREEAVRRLQELEKQNDKLQGKSALESTNNEKIDNANKVEPKFEVGDWVINTITNNVEQIIKIKSSNYICSGTLIVPFDNQHLLKNWTIQDTKNGDILVESERGVILMFRGIGNTRWDDVIDYHCYYDCYREKFIVQKGVEYWGNIKNNRLNPATKEQHDILFQKMKEAGYEWGAEEKELRKIEPKPAWSEEDEAALGDALWCCKQAASIAKDENDMGNIWYAERWLKSLKERIKGE